MKSKVMFLFAATLSVAAIQVVDLKRWPDGFRTSSKRAETKTAVKANKPPTNAPSKNHRTKKGSSGGGTSDFKSYDPNDRMSPESRERLRQYTDWIYRLMEEARVAIATRNTNSPATARIERWAELNPDGQELIPFLFDLYTMEGRPSLAREMIRPFCNSKTQDKIMIRCSFAAGRNGEVYPGQLEYILGELSSGFEGEQLTGTMLPSGSTSHRLAVLSALQIANQLTSTLDMRIAGFYLQWIKAQDPTNPMLSIMLGHYYRESNAYSLAAAAYAAGIPRSRGRLATSLPRLRDEMLRRAQGI